MDLLTIIIWYIFCIILGIIISRLHTHWKNKDEKNKDVRKK